MKMFKRILELLVVSLTLVSGALAGPLQDAVISYERGDYATALRLFRVLAQQGDAASQYNLGLMYDVGLGVSPDHSEAFEWYRRAAEQGNIMAQRVLGGMSRSIANPARPGKYGRVGGD